jgi:hypothetical protein
MGGQTGGTCIDVDWRESAAGHGTHWTYQGFSYLSPAAAGNIPSCINFFLLPWITRVEKERRLLARSIGCEQCNGAVKAKFVSRKAGWHELVQDVGNVG